MDILQKTAQQRHLVMTFLLRQAIAILQMPHLELSQFIQEEIDKNPVLEEIYPQTKLLFKEDIVAFDSLYEVLNKQIHENFLSEQEQKIAQTITTFLDEKGFLTESIEHIALELDQPIDSILKVLNILQTFDPPGIFAENLQHSLLLQLQAKGQQKSSTYLLVRDFFDDLIHGRFQKIKKKLPHIDYTAAIEKLALLQTRPLESIKRKVMIPITVDLKIQQTEQGWEISSNDLELPQFLIQSSYENMEIKDVEEKATVQLWLSQGKWLKRAIYRRRKLLLQIGNYLMKKQMNYFLGQGDLEAITLEKIAAKLHVHESTISRALSGKYIDTPRGILPLKTLVTSSPKTLTAKETLKKIIANENKDNPYTDEELSYELKKRGFQIARRTVTKYRKELKILSGSARKIL